MVFRVLLQQKNKQTNKCDPETEAGSHCQANMPDLNCIPPDQHDQDWAFLRGMVITLIDEFKNSDASTDINDSIEDVNDFFVTGSATAAVNSIDLSSAEIPDREIKIIKRYGRQDSSRCCVSDFSSFAWLGVLARRVLAIPATSTVHERLFSTAGNVMTKNVHVSRVTTWRS